VWHSRLRFRSPSPHTVSRRQRTVQSAMIRSCSASSNGRKSAEVSGCACRPSRPPCLEGAHVAAGLALAIPEVLVFDEKASNGRRAGRGLEYMELKPAVRFPRLEKGLSNRTDRCCRRSRQMIAAGSLRSPAAMSSGPAAATSPACVAVVGSQSHLLEGVPRPHHRNVWERLQQKHTFGTHSIGGGEITMSSFVILTVVLCSLILAPIALVRGGRWTRVGYRRWAIGVVGLYCVAVALLLTRFGRG
jgi:hypothetical protein